MRTVLGSHPRVSGRTEFERLAGDIEALASRFTPEKTLIGINLVGEKRMVRMNRVYKGRRGGAEILTFDYRGPQNDSHGIDDPAGEIFLCWKRLVSSAAARGVSRKAYLLRLVAHGLCHLEGHSHRDDDAAEKMQESEQKYLSGILTGRELRRMFETTGRNV